MSNGLLYIAGLLALALAALFAVPYFVDWNGYRGVFEEEASRVLGREVRVGGDVNVRLLPAPYVSFEKIRIADPTGTTGEPFFRVDSFTMRLSVPPLLKGVIEANEIELKRPVLRLAVDAEGSGNWRSLSMTPGALPFVPADVTLQSVKISDGVIAFHGPKGIGFAELDGLNGELKADSIDGPFAFKGTAKWQGGDREVRIATGAVDAEGSIRFKATVRGIAQSNVYIVDGRLVDFKGRSHVEGDITAKIELQPGQLSMASTPAEGKPDGKFEGPPLIDFKARLAGDAKALQLDDIALSFEHVGQPQLISGSASASWSDALSVELNLASRWLDLDRVVQPEEDQQSPIGTARNFILAVMESLPKNAESKVRFDLDQANLGGEAVSGIRLEVARSNGVLLLSNLRAGLPGGSKVSVDGSVADTTGGQGFQGDLSLRGTSLARFLDWAAKDKSVAQAVRNEGPFALQGRLALSDRGIDLTDAGAEIGGRPLTGEVHYSKKDRARLAIVLEGHEMDAAQLWPVGIGALQSMLVGADKQAAAKDTDASSALHRWLDVSAADLQLRLRAGQLITERGTLRDVDMDIGIEQGRLSMRACKFITDDGLQVALEGNVADVSAVPHGALQWIVAAPTKEAYTTFVRLLDLRDDARAQAVRFSALAPLRIAGTVHLGERAKGAADISADGSVQGGRLTATARLDGGLAGWRDVNADIAVTVASPDVARVLASLAARAPLAVVDGQQRAGEIFFKGVGTPAKGMLATTIVKAPGLFAAYDGRIELPADGARVLDGELRISSREASDVMAIGGLGSGGALRGTPVVGTFKVTSANHAIELRPQQLTIGGSVVSGSIALAYPDEGPAIVTAQLDVDSATIPGLLGLALDRKTQSAEVPAAEPLTAGKSIWPEHAFDFTALDGVEGKLGVGFGTLWLDAGKAVHNARLEVALAPGKISIAKLEGKVLGGDMVATLALDRAPGGASLVGDVRVTDMHIKPAATGAAPVKDANDAAASLQLEFSGRASTPGALVAVATGKGELSLGDVVVHAPTPLAVVATSEAVLTGEAGGSGEALTAALRAQIDASDVAVGPRKIAIEIADGVAKLAPFTLDSPAGTTKVVTTVDLASFLVDSAWLVEPMAPDVPQADRPRKGALPSVNVVYAGPLKDAWSLEPRITADQLERELAIRKMELDADQLERLHKADAERARKEDERRRALESDQGSAVPEQPVPPGAAAPVAPIEPVAPAGNPAAPLAVQPDPVVPDVLPSSSSAPGLIVPPAPGQEAQVLPPPMTDAAAGALPPGVAAPVPETNYRPRRFPPRQVAPGEQMLRALQNNIN